MSEQELENYLKEAIMLMNEDDPEIRRIETFEEAGVLTYNKGIVI